MSNYLCSTCDFCGVRVDEGGKRTKTNALCSAHILKTNNIPLKVGKRGVHTSSNSGYHLPKLSHKFSGVMNIDNGL